MRCDVMSGVCACLYVCELGCWFNFAQTFDKRTIYCKSFPIKFSHFHLLFLHFPLLLLPFTSFSDLTLYTVFVRPLARSPLLSHCLLVCLYECLCFPLQSPRMFFTFHVFFLVSFFVTWFSFDYQHAGSFFIISSALSSRFSLLFCSCRNYYFILFIPFIINLEFDIGFCSDDFDSLFCLGASFTLSLLPRFLSLICALIRFQSLNQWVCFISFTFRGIKVNYLITLPFRTNLICYE